jgi:hypothetical protein
MKKRLMLEAALSLSIVGIGQTNDGGIKPTIIPIEFHGETGRLDEYVEPEGTVNEITKTKKKDIIQKVIGC